MVELLIQEELDIGVFRGELSAILRNYLER